jgi:hypothetical protein
MITPDEPRINYCGLTSLGDDFGKPTGEIEFRKSGKRILEPVVSLCGRQVRSEIALEQRQHAPLHHVGREGVRGRARTL